MEFVENKMKLVTRKIKVLAGSEGKIEVLKKNLNSCLKLIVKTSEKFEASTMKKRKENEIWKIVEKNKKQEKETLETERSSEIGRR